MVECNMEVGFGEIKYLILASWVVQLNKILTNVVFVNKWLEMSVKGLLGDPAGVSSVRQHRSVRSPRRAGNRGHLSYIILLTSLMSFSGSNGVRKVW